MGQLEKAEIPALPNTGERMIPESTAFNTFWEHIYRYRFAARFARGKRILDIACGEGYGSAALLKAGAASLIGVDVSPEACEHARRKYGVDARVGDAQNIPLPDDSVDLIVSFETIEHVPDPARFLDECVRVLAPGGVLVVSTPNRDSYGELMPGSSNPFHCSEMDLREFEGILRPRFRRWSNYTQFPRRARWYQPAGLAVSSWFWWQLRGIRDLYWRLWWKMCGHIERDPTAEERRSPQDTILRREPPLADLFNLVAVHPSPWFAGEDPVYLIAVANVD
jgi:SAM-dependent methyltransferase